MYKKDTDERQHPFAVAAAMYLEQVMKMKTAPAMINKYQNL